LQHTVASLGGQTGLGVTPEGKKSWANLQRIVDKRGSTGKEGVGDTLQGVDTRVKSIKVTVISKERSSHFGEKINIVIPGEVEDGDD